MGMGKWPPAAHTTLNPFTPVLTHPTPNPHIPPNSDPPPTSPSLHQGPHNFLPTFCWKVSLC